MTNIQNICNKVAEFHHLIDQHKPAVIGVTESWCDSMVTDIELVTLCIAKMLEKVVELYCIFMSHCLLLPFKV